VLSGASENGFVASYTEGPGSMMVLLSNSGVNNPRTEQLVRDLAKLVITPKYRLGITIAFSPDAVTIQNVQDGTPAHEAGLRSGDEIVAVNGEPVDAETGKDRLLKLIEKGESLELRLKRGDGTLREIAIKPKLQ
jgi:S1-C subfamily serine protease